MRISYSSLNISDSTKHSTCLVDVNLSVNTCLFRDKMKATSKARESPLTLPTTHSHSSFE